MKKIIIILTATITLFTLCSCNKDTRTPLQKAQDDLAEAQAQTQNIQQAYNERTQETQDLQDAYDDYINAQNRLGNWYHPIKQKKGRTTRPFSISSAFSGKIHFSLLFIFRIKKSKNVLKIVNPLRGTEATSAHGRVKTISLFQEEREFFQSPSQFSPLSAYRAPFIPVLLTKTAKDRIGVFFG